MQREGFDFVALAASNGYSLALKRGPCLYDLASDLNGNCRVDLVDISIFAGKWLIDFYLADYATMSSNWLVDCFVEPTHPGCVEK